MSNIIFTTVFFKIESRDCCLNKFCVLLDFFNTATFKTTPVNIIIHTKVEETIEIIAAFVLDFALNSASNLAPMI